MILTVSFIIWLCLRIVKSNRQSSLEQLKFRLIAFQVFSKTFYGHFPGV